MDNVDWLDLQGTPEAHAARDELIRLRSETQPSVEDNSQRWSGMDGATAWHLIERHAENWADIGKMMNEWLAANQKSPSVIGKISSVEIPDDQIDQVAKKYSGMGGVEDYRSFAKDIAAMEREACADFQEKRSASRHGYDKHGDGKALRQRD